MRELKGGGKSKLELPTTFRCLYSVMDIESTLEPWFKGQMRVGNSPLLPNVRWCLIMNGPDGFRTFRVKIRSWSHAEPVIEHKILDTICYRRHNGGVMCIRSEFGTTPGSCGTSCLTKLTRTDRIGRNGQTCRKVQMCLDGFFVHYFQNFWLMAGYHHPQSVNAILAGQNQGHGP